VVTVIRYCVLEFKRVWQDQQVTGDWRKLKNEELNNFYSLPDIARVIKSRRMRWAAYVTRIRERRVVYRVLVGKPE